jgi:hypothetical protein
VPEPLARDPSRPRRIAHLSDIHFGGENRDAVAAVRAWLASNPPDLTVISGDLTRFGHPEEFAAAADWVASLEGPRLLTPGNHDTPWAGIWERISAPFALYQSHFGEPCGASWADDAMTLAAVNTARGIQIRWNWSKGEISRKQTDQANLTLSMRPPGSLGVMVCHHASAEERPRPNGFAKVGPTSSSPAISIHHSPWRCLMATAAPMRWGRARSQ